MICDLVLKITMARCDTQIDWRDTQSGVLPINHQHQKVSLFLDKVCTGAMLIKQIICSSIIIAIRRCGHFNCRKHSDVRRSRE